MKKILVVILIFGGLFAGLAWGLEVYSEKKITQLLNNNPDRKYDILFEEISISLFKQVASLKKIRLVPLDEEVATKVSGSLNSIELNGVGFLDLFFNRRLTINRLVLNDPGFRLIHKEVNSRPEDNSQALQGLFQDVISRGVISNFELRNGTAEFLVQGDSLMPFGNFTDLNISAYGIISDSVIVQNLVPFQLESIRISLKNLKLNTLDKQLFKFGELDFDSESKTILIKDLSLKYDDWEEFVNQMEYQKDVIEFSLKELTLSYIDTKNNIYGDWQIIAGLARLDGMVLDDYRDKNKPRPEEPEKPLFEGMVEQIPFPIELDTIRISNAEIIYRELLPGNAEPGLLKFDQVSAEVLNFTSSDSLQVGEMTLHASALFNGVAKMNLDFQVPYGKELFTLQASVQGFELSGINEILERMASVRVASGKVREMLLEMEVSRYRSSNRLTFQYEDLKLELLGEDHSKKKLKSAVANLFSSKSNLSTDSNYKKAIYVTDRNIYRGPFNLIWESTKEGLLQIVPGDVVQLFGPKKK
jgi:hypothetical protein